MTGTYRYSVPSEKFQGWAILFLDDAGCFAVLSDYGNYSYRWPPSGFAEGEDIRRFLLRCDDGYLAGKLCRDVYDGPATEKAVRGEILRRRREGWLEKDEAAKEWEAAREIEFSEYGFYDWACQTGIDDAWGLSCTGIDDSARAFFERAWPRLRDEIRKDLGLPVAQEVAAP